LDGASGAVILRMFIFLVIRTCWSGSDSGKRCRDHDCAN
jgi:hypothetical protein